MRIRMKIFIITGFQWKIRFLEGGSRTKNQYIGGIAWKGEALTFWRFKGLGGREVLAKKVEGVGRWYRKAHYVMKDINWIFGFEILHQKYATKIFLEVIGDLV